MYIDANSASEIVKAYPELRVFEEPPEFLSEKELERIGHELHFDVDQYPRATWPTSLQSEVND
jgi:hypothetical protein